ncbi:penicillin-binding protein 2 [Solemya velesiana gill symbiont]|uniref:Peptidoglycan D,D-transpeptidase MrdA n=1 Tax=Solemya velesiana gill symbiont TaxID=1918948 RepID=A0A1T2KYA6_9GAMM|nr:penicillin-binding protein 2 [Solemya velesiana gill symbiont]OOZ37791.1 penicillin-binding protein 2 [Solemya velesiana gill symbiont]
MPQITLKDYLRESRLFQHRAITAAAAVILLLGFLMLRLVDLQIIDHTHFTTLSRDNRVKVQPIPPTRGLIYDRNGIILAQNLPAHSLEITPEQVKDLDKTIESLSQIIHISEKDLKRFQRLRKQRRRFDSIPIRVRLEEDEVARFAINRHRFPGVDINAKLLRDYPMSYETAHVLGYVGRINESELQIIDTSNYSGTSHIGKTGIEKTYEDDLHGQVGLRQVEVNALGRVIRTLESTPPMPGKDLYLSLDAELQQVAMGAFGEENGAAVAIDPQTGDILALASKPGFDPNLFVEGISPSDYKDLQSSEHKPLFNRALRGQYPPGSTVKPFIGLAGLETGTVNFTQKKYCPGFYQLPNHSHKYRDWKKTGHGPINLSDAVTQSCDVYFYDLAHQMGIDKLHGFLKLFGFGSKTQIDITGELGGLLPSREWKKRARRTSWYPGETLIMGIGQGYFLTTPLQLASATATLATRGLKNRPKVVSAIKENGSETPTRLPAWPAETLPHESDHNWDDIIHSMTQVIEGLRGTAKRIRTPEYRIAGKTGTAQVFTVKQEEEYDEEKIAKKMRDHALFVAFAPVENPRIAVAVIVENGGHGGSVAAPIARRIMDKYLTEEPM